MIRVRLPGLKINLQFSKIFLTFVLQSKTNKTMKYKYLVTRIAYSSIEVEVEAENEVQAQEKAYEEASNTAFPTEYNADYETELISKG